MKNLLAVVLRYMGKVPTNRCRDALPTRGELRGIERASGGLVIERCLRPLLRLHDLHLKKVLLRF